MVTLVTKLTLNEQVYSQIKSMIARRDLPSGTPLVLRKLASLLGVSTIPVLEAIRRLERDGLVTVLPKWGATVREWSREEILESYYIRRALEGEAARHFITRASEEDKRRLVELNDRFDKLAATDPVKCVETDMELHLHIVRATKFQYLYDLVENSKIATATLFGVVMGLNEEFNHKESIGSHKALVKALLRKDPSKAMLAAQEHVDNTLGLVMKLEEKAEQRHRQGAR